MPPHYFPVWVGWVRWWVGGNFEPVTTGTFDQVEAELETYEARATSTLALPKGESPYLNPAPRKDRKK